MGGSDERRTAVPTGMRQTLLASGCGAASASATRPNMQRRPRASPFERLGGLLPRQTAEAHGAQENLDRSVTGS
jgi:hypothetical protein